MPERRQRYATLVLVGCFWVVTMVGCGLMTQTEHAVPVLSCDTDAEQILVTVGDNGSADIVTCEVGLPDGEPVRVDLSRDFDTDDTDFVWVGTVDASSGLTCDDISVLEGDCKFIAPGK